MKRDDFVAEIDLAEARAAVPRWRSFVKRAVMWLYCHRLLPASVVTWLFDRLSLGNA